MAAMPPAQAASVVLVATRPMPSRSMADSVEPGLNPYHPNHRMTAPMEPMARSWGGMGPPPSRLKRRPRRGPRAEAPERAMEPPTAWATGGPAEGPDTGPGGDRVREFRLLVPGHA